MGTDANAFRRNLIFLDSLLLANGQQRGMDMPAILGSIMGNAFVIRAAQWLTSALTTTI
jgi:hypothetical protein